LWYGWYLAMIVSLTLVSLVGAYVDRKFYFHPNSVNTEKLPN
jgi:hypothetical protein